MSTPLVIWVFMVLVQQQGMAGGAGADKPACEAARTNLIAEMKTMGQEIIAASECQKFTLTPPTK